MEVKAFAMQGKAARWNPRKLIHHEFYVRATEPAACVMTMNALKKQ